MTKRIWGSLALISAAAVAVACAWDSDTLAMEAKGLPKVIDVIGGRFDRNPDLYYEMRLERALTTLNDDPHVIVAYGDAAVAFDKLGRGPEAIDLLEKRLEWLLELYEERAANGPAFQHAYQLWANLGTVRVHDWLRRGSPEDDLESLEKAISEIEAAIKIEPDAHFGREFVQLHVMRLLLLDKQGDHGSLGGKAADLHIEFLDFEGKEVDQHAHNRKLIEGAIGMIVMGGGWESPDMYAFLAGLLGEEQYNVLAMLALEREQELHDAGRKQVFSPGMRANFLRAIDEINAITDDDLDSHYAVVRENGDLHKEHRDEFMLAKLEKGEHPDTHDDFWDGYEEVERVEFEPTTNVAEQDMERAWFWGIGVLIPVGFFALWYMTRKMRRKAVS